MEVFFVWVAGVTFVKKKGCRAARHWQRESKDFLYALWRTRRINVGTSEKVNSLIFLLISITVFWCSNYKYDQLPTRPFLRLNKTFTFCLITNRAIRFWFVSPSPLQRDAQLSIAHGFRLSTRSDSHVLLPLLKGDDFHNYMYCCMLVSNFYVKRLSPPPLPPPREGRRFSTQKAWKKIVF